MAKIYYYEVQRFRQKWLWMLILGMLGIFAWGIIQQLIIGKPWGNNPASNLGLILLSIIPVGLTSLFILTKLKFSLSDSGINYQFVPFHLKMRRIEWNRIENVELIHYKPIKEFGGWGIRYGAGGKAYIVSGNNGIKLKLKGSKRYLLIGTNQPEKVKTILSQLKDKDLITLRN